MCVCLGWWGCLLVCKRETPCERVPLDRIMLPSLIDPKQIKRLFSAAWYFKFRKQRRETLIYTRVKMSPHVVIWTGGVICHLLSSGCEWWWWLLLLFKLSGIVLRSDQQEAPVPRCSLAFGSRSSLCVCPPVPQFDHRGHCKNTLFLPFARKKNEASKNKKLWSCRGALLHL